MIEDQLELARKNYLKSSTLGPNIGESWEQLQSRLGKQKHIYLGSYSRPLMVVAILATITPLFAIQASKPGQILYPAKLIADDVVAKISGKIEYKIERRGQEVIDLSTDSSQAADEATSQYQQSLQEAKTEAQKSGSFEQFNQILEKQQLQFEKALEKDPPAASHLEEAIQRTEEAKDQVKGVQDKPSPSPQRNSSQPPQRGQSDEHRQDSKRGVDK